MNTGSKTREQKNIGLCFKHTEAKTNIIPQSIYMMTLITFLIILSSPVHKTKAVKTRMRNLFNPCKHFINEDPDIDNLYIS